MNRADKIIDYVVKQIQEVGENFGWQIGKLGANWENGYMQSTRDCKVQFRKEKVKEDIQKILNDEVNQWIPCSERLPSENGKYFATGIKGSVYIAEFSKGVINGKPVSLWCRSGGHYCNVIAWMELPPAYEGE